MTLSGVPKPTTYDAVAIYVQDPSDTAIGLNKLLKYKWANANLSYVSTDSTTFRCGLQVYVCVHRAWFLGVHQQDRMTADLFHVVQAPCTLVASPETYAEAPQQPLMARPDLH